MPRPTKKRQVGFLPQVTYFKPAGVPLKDLGEIAINVEELEAVRLKNMENYDQETAAMEMNVSRPTYQRILNAAYQKIAEALVEGKAIKIEGGSYYLAPKKHRHQRGCKKKVLR